MMKKTLSLILTRFLFLLTVLFVFCFNNGAFPFLYYIQQFTTPLLHIFIPWFAAKFLNLADPITVFTNGSGDTTYDNIVLLWVLITALAGTLLWSVLDRKRKSHDQLFYWLTVVLRFYVGFMLVHYGIAKLNNGQFPSLSPYRLSSTYGNSSPMGLAWSFLGFSDGYKWFMFMAEVMGILLFFRKTATIGAFMCLMTSLNIMAINYFFDVPVKLLSTALVLMCLIILAPNIIRLFKFFFKGAVVGLKQPKAPAFKIKWLWITTLVMKYAAILVYVGIPLFMALKVAWIDKKADKKTAVYGAYEVKALNWETKSPPADSTFSSDKWKLIGFDDYDFAYIRYGENDIHWCTYKMEPHNKTLKFTFRDDPKVSYTFAYQKTAPNQLILKGDLFGEPAVITLNKKNFNLTDNGFHWISEYPNNR